MSSSISRAELEAMDRDELIETITQMDDRLTHVQTFVFETLLPRVDDLEAQLEEQQALEGRVNAAEADAKAALRAATTGDADESKTDIAMALTRNLLVTKVANGCPAPDRPVTISKIREQARPDHNLEWQTVRNAWDKLLTEWPQFHETTTGGSQAMSIRPSNVTPALARTVEADLGRDDLTQRFVGDDGGGGA